MANYENLHPDQLQHIIHTSPVAYLPLGTLEYHGWHLPLGFDALKAHAICGLACEQTGGVVLPPLYFGFGGGHRDYFGSVIASEAVLRGCLDPVMNRLSASGFKVMVLLTGHYPQEQVDAVHQIAREFENAHPQSRVIGLSEPEAYPGEFRGDHAAHWETSIALYLVPQLVKMGLLERHSDPMYGICGQDPRDSASAQIGKQTVTVMVDAIVKMVKNALNLST